MYFARGKNMKHLWPEGAFKIVSNNPRFLLFTPLSDGLCVTLEIGLRRDLNQNLQVTHCRITDFTDYVA